jgi:predicted amidohydrolase
MINESLTVAGIQALPKGYLLNPENISHAVDLLKEASKLGVDFACFPEAYPALGEEVICDAASEFRLYVIASFLLERRDGLYNNESVLISPRGEVIGRQRKVHPAPGLEPYAPGYGYNIMQTPWGKIGILICIDGWGFPEGFHHMSQGGVDLIFNPCLIFRKKPQKKMSLLTRVLDYKLPIIAPNNAFWSFKIFSDDPGMPPEGGQSLILSPPAFQTEDEIKKFMREASSCEGWIIAEAGRDEEILVTKVDPQAVKNARSIWTKCFGACAF